MADEIESTITLPDPNFQVSDYTRYYRMDGGKVMGVYLSIPIEEEGPVWLEADEQGPMVLDGGCGVVSFVYDPDRREFESINCNGEA
jgi:hypothetical protein